jgi:hypothetical protein
MISDIFGLAFLNPEDVGDSFAEDLIPDMPSDNKVQDFGDYVVSTYVDDNEVCFELDQHASLDLYSASSVKQQFNLRKWTLHGAYMIAFENNSLCVYVCYEYTE